MDNHTVLTIGELLEQLYVQLIAPAPTLLWTTQLLAALEHHVRCQHKSLIVIDNLERFRSISNCCCPRCGG
ncbi:MAG: hypothetical protein R2911_23315 [Caldilineaceae bacterium]